MTSSDTATTAGQDSAAGTASLTAGMVGLGAMGRPIAEHIARAGFDTLAYDLSPHAQADGVRRATSLAEVAAADVVIVIVPTDEDVVDVVAGTDGLIANGHPGMVIIVSASVRPDTCQMLAEAGAAKQISVIDGALTGGVRGAESGEINLLVGGDQDTADRAAPVLNAFCKSYHVLGPVGAGQVGKSANNLIHWAQIVAIHEAFRMARALGVSPSRLRPALQDGPTDSRTLREIEQMRYTWYIKDIEIAQDLAAGVGQSLPVAALSRQLMDDITVAATRELLEG